MHGYNVVKGSFIMRGMAVIVSMGVLMLAIHAHAEDFGWEVLFDGSDVGQWRGFNQEEFPHGGWEIVDGQLRAIPDGDAVDIITRDMYGDFELYLEWMTPPGERGNSGVFYHVTETETSVTRVGPEIQILNDEDPWLEAEHSVPAPKRAAASLFALAAPNANKRVKPEGEYNTLRLVVENRGGQVWLNGPKVLDYDLDDEAMQERIAESRFADLPRFGREPEGHIALQHHGDDVWFRNIWIRRIPN